MIRRTLLNRARRQRDLARTLIARHPLAAHNPRQPHVADRSAAIDVAPWPAPAPVAADSAQADFALSEAQITPAAWAESPAASINNLAAPLAADVSAAIVIANSTALVGAPAALADARPPLGTTAAQPQQPTTPAALPEPTANDSLADLVRRMRAPGWVAPAAISPETPASLPEPTANDPLADLMRRMRTPGWVAPAAISPETPAALPEPTANDPLADLVGQMRTPGWVAPAAISPEAPAALPEPTASDQLTDLMRRMRAPGWVAPAAISPETPASLPEPTANDPLADLVGQMRKPTQRAKSPRLDRARIPLGQRMIEAADFGQKLASPQQVDQVAAPVQDQQPAPVVSETEPPAPDRSGGDIALPSAPIVPVEFAEEPSISASADTKTTARMFLPEDRHAVAAHSDAPAPNSSSPLHKVALPVSAPLAAPRILSQLQQADATKPLPAEIAPSHAPAVEIASRLQETAAPSELPVLASAKPLPAEIAPSHAPAVEIASRLQETAAPSELPVLAPADQLTSFEPPPATTHAMGRPTTAAVAATPSTAAIVPTPLAPSRQAATDTTEPVAQFRSEMHEPQDSAPSTPRKPTDRDRQTATDTTEPVAQFRSEMHEPQDSAPSTLRKPTDRDSTPVVATPTAGHGQTHAETTRPGGSEPQPLPSEVKTLVALTQARAASAFDAVETPAEPTETAQESQPVLFRQPEAAVPPAQSPSPPERPAQPVAHPDVPIGSASVAPTADGRSLSDARSAQIEDAVTPPGASESAPTGTERDAPEAGAARLLPTVQPIPAHIADTAHALNAPNIAQQPAPAPAASTGSQLKADSVPEQPKDLPALNQHLPEYAHIAAEIAVVPASENEPVAAQTVETPLAHSSSLEQRSSVLPEASAARQIDAVRAAASTAAGLLDQEPHSGLPSPDRRSPSVRDLPVAAADIPGTATPETGSPQAWAARLAFQRQEPPPPPAPIAASTPAILHDDTAPGERNGLYGIQAASAQLLAATADQHPATPRRFIAARRVDQAATPAVPADTHTATIERSPVASAAVADVPAAIVPEPRSPQAWAARFATHSQATALGKAESTSARPPTPLSLAPIAPVTPPVGVDAPAASEPDAPQTWAARLFPQAQPAQLPNIGTPTEQRSHALDSAPQAMLRNALPTPTAETTRRFLTPLVGIDPATVRIFRGPQAEQVTAAYKAEALASGDTIALSAQHSEDTPAALGVLAHELTHIARQRDARFVPPLAQRSRAFIGAGADEELLAQSVDAQVQQIARKRAAPATSRLQSHAAESGMLHDLDNTTPALPSPHAAPKAQSAIHSADWGSLPAPWEVLPEWLTTPPATEAALPVRSQSPGPAQPIAERNAAPPQSQRMSGTAAVRETQPVQLAEASRSLATQPAQSAPTSTPAQQPTPDLDALARQVYAVLKQRLAAERRRSQS